MRYSVVDLARKVTLKPQTPEAPAHAPARTTASAERPAPATPAGPRPGAATSARSIGLGARRYPLVLPTLNDPRLHLALVIVSIHVLGQVALGFRVSVVQILAAILTCAVIEVAITFRQTGTIVWPASAMLTGSGVALILRVLGTENGEYWSWRGWYIFAIVAGASLLSKYALRYRGSHVFNPSNLGLVVAFLVLGSTRVEPLDFWWAPLDGWMVAAYAIILVGGLLITKRLHLLGMSTAFWLTLAAGIGLLAASGHCMTARWSFAPVCGSHFWWVIVTSPEILIFLFFMISDPKTVPAGRVARIAFGAGVALVCTLLMAPQTTEFGTKVALLAGLVVMCAARYVLARTLPAADSDQDRLPAIVTRLATRGDRSLGRARAFARGTLVGAAAIFVASGIVAAGAPARGSMPVSAVAATPEIAAEIDPSTLPTVTVDASVLELGGDLTGSGAREIAITLAENLEVESQALLDADARLLTLVDHGDRLEEMRGRIDEATSKGETTVDSYRFDALHLTAIPAEGQAALSLGFEARGTLVEVTYDADGDEIAREASPVARTFVLSQPTGGRWLIVGTLPLGSG